MTKRIRQYTTISQRNFRGIRAHIKTRTEKQYRFSALVADEQVIDQPLHNSR
ncbi:hypothetical protein KR50_32140 [Jeotgalibacillus campisalis]|uniref:Uncharacterized protein n=1 Tax=Jeotgalibacillus campisalis TaxID=220754 RepID=A0A0C2RPL7_9BACL|nr:hypothetical protein KR50_32140 [Jeotgalibacillus campisalis]